jgi:hypothetical protein
VKYVYKNIVAGQTWDFLRITGRGSPTACYFGTQEINQAMTE